MSNKIRGFIQLIILIFCFQHAFAEEIDQLGVIEFPTSASPEAQGHFLTGLAYLHCFSFKEAREEFQQAQALDNDFVLAYWGEILTYNHPLYPATDLVSPSQVLDKLSPNRQTRLNLATNELERRLLNAVEVLTLTNGESLDTAAYMESMKFLYESFPTHPEVQAFYALSLLTVAAERQGRERLQLRQQAGQIASQLLQSNDRHPGAIHYLIHSYDDPVNAPLALDAADRFVEVAPLAPHARHMPTHIYILMGRWFDVAELNETAFYNEITNWEMVENTRSLNHAMDFGQYADLQMADYEAAALWLERAEDILARLPADTHTTDTLAKMQARLIIESKQWQILPINETTTNEELLAIGLSAVNMNALSIAREANQLLLERIGQESSDYHLLISQLELEASLMFTDGNIAAGLSTIDEAIALSENLIGSDPIPVSLKPPHELKGEFLMREGRYQEALEAYEESQQITPFRPWTILGLARSYAALNDTARATEYYQRLLESWDDDRLLGVSEAMTYLSLNQD